ncbi:MAG: hypothetical protein A2W25_09235 [candidate division Zixibacteria bacterium RBG_16_53_22]|nr:MAG: hypothetical protein A2W25_09235 [candidate division Zixibacteria bacterium RBG_16_53_22]
MLIADLVAERCFHEIARKIIETRGAILNPETRHDRELQEAYTLSKKYGKRIHEALVDQNLMKESRH